MGRSVQRLMVILGILIGANVLGLGAAEGGPPEEPFLRYQTIPADSTDARLDALLEDPVWFAFGFDSTLALGGLDDPATLALLTDVAAIYHRALDDSLLLWDLALVSSLDPATRPAWYQAMAADDMAGIHTLEGNHAAAADSFRVAALGYRTVGDLRREAIAWGSLGVALWSTGDFEAVVAAYDEALAARRRLGDMVLVGRTLNGLGSAYLRLADLDQALDYYEQARVVREALPDRDDLGVTLTYIGNVRYQQGYLEQARANYLHAFEVFPDGTPESRLVQTRTGLANVHFELGEYDRALALYEQNVDAALAANSAVQADRNRYNMARTLRFLGEYLEARRLLELVRESQEAAENTFELAQTRNAIGEVYLAMGEQERALSEFREARTLAESSGNEESRADALHHIAVTYLEMGLAEKAIETCDEARTIFLEIDDPTGVRDILGLMASGYEDLGQSETSLDLNRQALEIDTERGLKANLAQDHTAIGNALNALGRYDEAQVELAKAEQYAEEVGRRDIQWYVYMIIADTYERAGVLDSARVANDRAIEVLESLRGEAFSEGAREGFLGGARSIPYESQVQVLAKQHANDSQGSYAAEALGYAERGKARAMLDILAAGQVDLDAGWSAEDKETRELLQRRLNETQLRLRRSVDDGAPRDSINVIKRSLRDLEGEYAALAERARLANPQLATVDAGGGKSLDDLREILLQDPGDLLLEFAVTDSSSFVWAVTDNGLSLHELPGREVLTDLVETARRGLSSPLAAEDSTLLEVTRLLYRILLEPVAAELADAKQIYIVPDGVLHFLPFEVLLATDATLPQFTDENARSQFFSGLDYALASKRVRYGPSATTLCVLTESHRNRREHSMDLLAVGDPAFGSSLAPLPFSRTEVQTIAGSFPANRTQVLIGEEAREATLRDASFCAPYRILHFATHGLVDSRRPELSSLVLAEPTSDQEDGYLQAREIFGLGLTADLVVLSACETGLGKQVRGEGVLGLPRAFFFAGAPAVVVSLWSVADASTSELMAALYQGLAADTNPADALSVAKRTLRDTTGYGHPFYWAPFVIMGTAEGR